MKKETKTNQPYEIGVIAEDYINLSGELVAQKGAAGLIVGEHNSMLTMSFAHDNSGKHVSLDGGGRKTQNIPIYFVNRLSKLLHPTFDQIINSYKHALLSHLLHTGETGALQVFSNTVSVLMDDNENVGFISFNEIGIKDPSHYLKTDWDESVGNWKSCDEPHSMDISYFPMLSYDELIKLAQQEQQAQVAPRG